MVTLRYSVGSSPKFHIPGCTQRLRLCKLLLLMFGCFRSCCCCTVLWGHSWEEQEVPPKLENVQRWEGRGWFGGFLWSSQQQERDLRCHIPKSTSCFPVCPTRHLHRRSHTFMLLLFKLFLLFVAFCICPLQGFLPAQEVDGQSQGWLKHLCCVCSPKTQCKLFSAISWPSSRFPSPFWKLALEFPLWKCCPSAEWEFFPGELEPVAAPWVSLCQISSDEGFITVQHLHFPISSEISFMAPGAVGTSSLHLPSFPHNLNRHSGMGLGFFLY